MQLKPVVRLLAIGLFAFGFCITLPKASAASTEICSDALTREIPRRDAEAPTGSTLMKRLGGLRGAERDMAVVQQVLTGNVPEFLRQLHPVSIAATLASGQQVLITLCVTPEYLSVGSDQDFVRMPMGLSAAARVAQEFGFLLPTTKMVDQIYRQAQTRVAPSPMKPTSQMSSTAYLVEHNQTVSRQFADAGGAGGALAAGHKKDIVLSNRLYAKPGRIAIYGWHRTSGKPIQPLSTVHGANYADYSHGVRLVSQIAFVNGEPRALADIMRDRELSRVVSDEGPIENVFELLASLAR